MLTDRPKFREDSSFSGRSIDVLWGDHIPKLPDLLYTVSREWANNLTFRQVRVHRSDLMSSVVSGGIQCQLGFCLGLYDANLSEFCWRVEASFDREGLAGFIGPNYQILELCFC